MLGRILQERIESLGLPRYATNLIFIAIFCIPIVLIMLMLPKLMGAPGTAHPKTAAPSGGVSEAPKTIQPDSKKAEFQKIKEWMTVKEVQAIMGVGDIEIYAAPKGHTAEMHAYSYADGKVQVVVFADGQVAGMKEFTK